MRDPGAGDGLGPHAGQPFAGDRDLAAPPHRPGDGPQGRGLAGAVRAEQRDHLSFGDSQGHAVKRDDLPVTGRDVVELEQRRHRGE